MLNFQTDYDEVTGEQVLTCFLLPQLDHQNLEAGNGTIIFRPFYNDFSNSFFLLNLETSELLTQKKVYKSLCIKAAKGQEKINEVIGRWVVHKKTYHTYSLENVY